MEFILWLAAIVVIFLLVASRRSSEFKVVRSAAMNASPADIFIHINDFHKWVAWSPWAKLDPAAQNIFEGTAAGAGSIFKWSGNRQVGQGAMTIIDSRPSELIKIKLDFIKPMVNTCYCEFSFKPEGDGTLVTWSMTGTNNFMAKIISMFVNCEKIVGGMYEEGLENIKRLVEPAKS